MKRTTTYALYVRTCMLALLALAVSTRSTAQYSRIKALFIGNIVSSSPSSLPMLLNDIASSVHDTLDFDGNFPGGYSLKDHATDPITQAKIMIGKWNYVVFQEHPEWASQEDADAEMNVYPYAHQLDSMVHKWNPCGRSVYYMTWGYADGDPAHCPTNPYVCDFEGMDSLIDQHTMVLADLNQGIIGPVGQVFRAIAKAAPGINLYQPDRRLASDAGLYAAAMTYYSLLFRKNPSMITFNYTLTPPDAMMIRDAVRDVVFANLVRWHVGEYDPKVGFTASVSSDVATFNSSSSRFVTNFKWYFGDGDSSTDANPVHTYKTAGTYKVKLYGDDCLKRDSASQDVDVVFTGMQNINLTAGLELYPNPAGNTLFLKIAAGSQPAISFGITNLLGQKMISTANYDYKPIDVSMLPKGIYLINMNVSGQSINRKFVKD